MVAVERYAILDTGREDAFEDVADLTADILEAPIAVVNFIAADGQWFKAEVGIGTDTLPHRRTGCDFGATGNGNLNCVRQGAASFGYQANADQRY